MYVYKYLLYTHTSKKKLYTKEYISTVDNLEEKLSLSWQGEKWGGHMGTKPKNKEKVFLFTKSVCIITFMHSCKIKNREII